MTDAASIRFNEKIRALIAATRVADLTDLADSDALSAFGEQLDAMTSAISAAAVPGQRMQVALTGERGEVGAPRPDMSFDDPAEFFPYSPVLGALNPISPMAQFSVTESGIQGTVTLGAPYNGPPGSVHGGVIALVLDELLGSTTLASGVGGFTGTLSIRYIAQVPLDTELELHGWVDRKDGRKTFAVGEIRLAGEVLSRAEGIFIGPKVGPVFPD